MTTIDHLPTLPHGISKTGVRVRSLTTAALTCIILREAFGGAIRYYLDLYGLGVMWFIPDLILAAAITSWFALALSSTTPNVAARACSVVLVLLWASFIGIMAGNPIASIASALKLSLPIVCLLFCDSNFFKTFYWKRTSAFILLTLLGLVFVDRFIDFPWLGHSFDQFGITREATRERWISGVDRLAGPAANNATAGVVMLLCALIYSQNISKPRRKLLAYFLAALGCYLATARTPMMAVIAAGLVDWYVSRSKKPERRAAREKKSRTATRLIYILAICVPFLSFMFASPNFEISIATDSLNDRISNTWPQVVSMINSADVGGWLLGLGYGSIGTPSMYAGKYVHPISAVDNFFLYHTALFGFSSFLLFLWGYNWLGKIPPINIPTSVAFGVLAFAVSAESPSASLLLGISLCGSLRNRAYDLGRLPVKATAAARRGNTTSPQVG